MVNNHKVFKVQNACLDTLSPRYLRKDMPGFILTLGGFLYDS